MIWTLCPLVDWTFTLAVITPTPRLMMECDDERTRVRLFPSATNGLAGRGEFERRKLSLLYSIRNLDDNEEAKRETAGAGAILLCSKHGEDCTTR